METFDKKKWKATVLFMQQDIEQYLQLLDKRMLSLEKSKEANELIKIKSKDFITNSDLVLKNLINYSNFMEKGLECDDLQCDTYFKNYANLFEDEIKTHFEQYDELKNIFVKYLSRD